MAVSLIALRIEIEQGSDLLPHLHYTGLLSNTLDENSQSYAQLFIFFIIQLRRIRPDSSLPQDLFPKLHLKK